MKDDIKFNVPLYTAYISPNGFLDSSRESHALWNYYTMARASYERHIVDPIVLVGQKDGEPDFKQLFASVARMYGVKTEAMAKCWDLVDAQCFALDLPKMPSGGKYRFDYVQEVTSAMLEKNKLN